MPLPTSGRINEVIRSNGNVAFHSAWVRNPDGVNFFRIWQIWRQNARYGNYVIFTEDFDDFGNTIGSAQLFAKNFGEVRLLLGYRYNDDWYYKKADPPIKFWRF